MPAVVRLAGALTQAFSPAIEARALSDLGDGEYNRGRFLSAYHYFDQ
jgi:hypothetical protein